MTHRQQKLVAVCALPLVIFMVLSPVLRADFVAWDDDYNIYANPHLRSLSWGQLKWAFADFTYAWRYQPLSWMTWSVIHTFFGWNPCYYHLAVLLFHAGNTALVFLLADRLLHVANQRNPELGTGWRMVCAALAAALWALHPMRVENAAWAVELLFTQSTFFFLLSLLAYLRKWQPGKPGGQQKGFPWAAWSWFAVSLLSYPLALGGLVVFTVLDFYPLRRLDGNWWEGGRLPARRVWLEKAPFLLVGLTAAAVSFYARTHTTGQHSQPPTLEEFGWFSRLMQALYVWAYYTWKPWFPLHLSPGPTTFIEITATSCPLYLSAALVVGITALVVWGRRQWPWALAMWASYLALLVPVLGLTEHPHFTCDRYDYLPGVVWAIAIGAALWRISSRPRLRTAGMACALVLGMLWGALSVRQTRIWHDSVTLFTHVLRELGTHPYSADIHWRLGGVLARQGKVDEAMRHYQTSLQIEPLAKTYAAFGLLMETNGNPEAALTNYQELLQLTPDPIALAKVGQMLCQLDRSGEAISFYRTTLIAFPNLAPVLNNLAWVLATDSAATNRNGPEAVQLAERACALTDRRDPVLIGTLAAAYAEAGRFTEAIQAAQEARDLAQVVGQPEVVEKNRQLLELYRSGKAYREPAPPHGASRAAQ